MKANVLFLVLILLGVFFATYALRVEDPFSADRLDFKAYAIGMTELSLDTSNMPASRIAVTIFIMVLARIGIWSLGRLLKT